MLTKMLRKVPLASFCYRLTPDFWAGGLPTALGGFTFQVKLSHVPFGEVRTTDRNHQEVIAGFLDTPVSNLIGLNGEEITGPSALQRYVQRVWKMPVETHTEGLCFFARYYSELHKNYEQKRGFALHYGVPVCVLTGNDHGCFALISSLLDDSMVLSITEEHYNDSTWFDERARILLPMSEDRCKMLVTT